MSRIEQLLSRMRNNPLGWRIEELQVLARYYGIHIRAGKGNYVFFTFSSTGQTLSMPARRPIKPVYAWEFLALLEEEL